MDLGLAGKVAVVAGSTSGLGLATATSLAVEGANVVITGRRGDLAREQASQLASAIGVEVDLTEPTGPQRVIEAAHQEFGTVDILVWNSGGPKPGGVVGMSLEDIAQGAALLVNPFIRFLDLTVAAMRQRRWGRIVAIGSSGVQQPIPNLAVSNALRASVAGICKTLASEVAADGLTVNLVLPGRFATGRVAELDERRAQATGTDIEEVVAESRAAIPAGRYGDPSEFGDVVAFLCSERASYVTGSQVRVDGGLIRSVH